MEDSDKSNVLWIKGGPGKGKTMLMMALADELSFGSGFQRPSDEEFTTSNGTGMLTRDVAVAYFFCQNSYEFRDNAPSVLHGLISLLASQSIGIQEQVRIKYNAKGKRIFENFYTLRSIVSDICNHTSMNKIYFLIDALDECVTELPELLKIVGDIELGRTVKLKWLISSRERVDIENLVLPLLPKILDLDTRSANKEVLAFIRFKIDRVLSSRRMKPSLKYEVEKWMLEKAEGSFLWIDLALEELAQVLPFKVLREVNSLPLGLEPLYDRIMKKVNSVDRTERQWIHEYYGDILRTITVVYRPLYFREFFSLTELPVNMMDTSSFLRLVKDLSPFLQQRKGIISFSQRSSKEYFVSGRGDKNSIFTEYL